MNITLKITSSLFLQKQEPVSKICYVNQNWSLENEYFVDMWKEYEEFSAAEAQVERDLRDDEHQLREHGVHLLRIHPAIRFSIYTFPSELDS